MLAGAAFGAVPAAPLGLDFSEWFPAATQIATDSSGALYVLAPCPISSGTGSCVTKVSADGKSALWQDVLGFPSKTMAVSASGSVFVIPTLAFGNLSISVAKLNAAGAGLAWNVSTGISSFTVDLPILLSVDSQGRAYVAATTALPNTEAFAVVVRLSASGSGIEYSTTITGEPTAMAVDGSGAAIVAGNFYGPLGFAARLAPDGSRDYYTMLSQAGHPTALALDTNGNPVVLASSVLLRLNSMGAVTASISITGAGSPPALALDAAGNIIYAGSLIGQLYPVKNSIAACLPSVPDSTNLASSTTVVGSSPLLSVIAPGGSTLQVTYLPGAGFRSTVLLASGLNGSLFAVAAASADFAPTQTGPFDRNVGGSEQTFLLHLTQQSAAKTAELACVGNSATYVTRAVAPGELVTLTGSGLGPAQGIQTQASTQSPFPTSVSGTQVTFDGVPAPLLWVHDSQINAVVPWQVTPGATTQICVAAGESKPSCVSWPVAQTAPGVFTVDGRNAAALNQDGSVNTAGNPALPGSIVSVFASGLGSVIPLQVNGGLVRSPLPSNVSSAGVGAQWLVPVPPFGLQYVSATLPVAHAGPAPGLFAGISQINFRIPAANEAVPYSALFFLTLPGITSPSFSVYVGGQ